MRMGWGNAVWSWCTGDAKKGSGGLGVDDFIVKMQVIPMSGEPQSPISYLVEVVHRLDSAPGVCVS